MPASEQALLIATGADRPGVLDDVSLFLHERRANLLESRVSLLGGRFALLLLLSGDADVLKKIGQELPELGSRIDISISLHPARQGAPGDMTPMRLRATGTDPAAAVHRLSHLMRVLGTNIENIETTRKTNIDGSAQFELEMELSVPRATPVMMLRQYVEGLAGEVGITCELTAM